MSRPKREQIRRLGYIPVARKLNGSLEVLLRSAPFAAVTKATKEEEEEEEKKKTKKKKGRLYFVISLRGVKVHVRITDEVRLRYDTVNAGQKAGKGRSKVAQLFVSQNKVFTFLSSKTYHTPFLLCSFTE